MAAPKPSNKGARMTRGKTAAIAASRAATKVQTAPGTEYKAKKAAQKSAGYGGSSKVSAAEDKRKKSKERLAKMREMTADIRSRRQGMASKLNPFKK